MTAPDRTAPPAPSGVHVGSPPIRTGVVAIVGNPRAGSRTAAVAREAALRIAAHLRSGPPRVVDLAETAAPFGPDAAERLARELRWVATAAAVVVASPTYKASYTGLLKAFLDLIPSSGLRGAVAVPVMTLGGPGHTLAADVHLRPVLLELDASLPTAALVVPEQALGNIAGAVDAWWETAGPALSGIGSLGPLDALGALGAR